jgi:hypothetical protein
MTPLEAPAFRSGLLSFGAGVLTAGCRLPILRSRLPNPETKAVESPGLRSLYIKAPLLSPNHAVQHGKTLCSYLLGIGSITIPWLSRC